jgi:hypothetical protein
VLFRLIRWSMVGFMIATVVLLVISLRMDSAKRATAGDPATPATAPGAPPAATPSPK